MHPRSRRQPTCRSEILRQPRRNQSPPPARALLTPARAPSARQAPARRRSSLSWHSPHIADGIAPSTPSSSCPHIEEPWTQYVNWVAGVDDLRGGRRYEREGRILKKRPQDDDDSHSDGELEVLNREENVDFDPAVDPTGLPLIVSPGGTCYFPDEARALGFLRGACCAMPRFFSLTRFRLAQPLSAATRYARAESCSALRSLFLSPR